MSSKANKADLTVIVLGYIVRGPIGGMAWHYLQYILGLKKMGHDVYFFEDSDDYPSCYNPMTHTVDENPDYGIKFIDSVFKQLDLGPIWAYHNAHQSKWIGPCCDQINEIISKADVIINISGVNPIREWYLKVNHRILIDTDPLFTQVKHLQNEKALQAALKHTAFFSFGENISDGKSKVPDDGIKWLATRQPVSLDHWEVTEPPSKAKYTTIMQWTSYPPLTYQDQSYGMKSHSFDEFLNLPKETSADFEIALGSESAPRDQIKGGGWHLCDPLTITRDPWTTQKYIQQSKGEFSVAKHGYVVSDCGWFSERSAGYLASGRPVIVQDTGFQKHIVCGRGLLTFRNFSEAKDAIEQVENDYKNHCLAAREISEEYFDSQKVLSRIIGQVYDTNITTKFKGSI